MGTLRASEVYRDGALKLIAIESVDLQRSRTGPMCLLHGGIEPVAVVVCGGDGAYAVDMEGDPLLLADLRRDVPGLEAMI